VLYICYIKIRIRSSKRILFYGSGMSPPCKCITFLTVLLLFVMRDYTDLGLWYVPEVIDF
jgi:hypothetical protein